MTSLRKLKITSYKCQILKEATPSQTTEIWTEETASPASKTTVQHMLNLTGFHHAITCTFCWTGRGREPVNTRMEIHIWRATATVLFHSKTWTICRELFSKQKWYKAKMPFDCYSVPHKECHHFRQSKWNVYAGFLLLPHLSHLGSLLINLREAKREILPTLLLSLPHPLHCLRAQLLETEVETTKGSWLPKSYFQQIAKSWQSAYFHASALPAPCWQGCVWVWLSSVPAGLATCSVPRAGLPVQQELHLTPTGLLCQVMLQALPPPLLQGHAAVKDQLK